MTSDPIAWQSLLIVPLADCRYIDKAPSRGADAIVLDLEDGVALERKAEARGHLAEASQRLRAAGCTVLVRVNASVELCVADLEAACRAGLSCILLPKVESVAALDALEPELQRLEALAAPGMPSVQWLALLETPAGVMQASAIAAHPRVVGLAFGSEDYSAALGVPSHMAELAWPAQAVAVAARAQGLAAFGVPGTITDFSDFVAFEALVRRARAMGFTGCMGIHPGQVAAARRAFEPTADEIATAQGIVQAAATADYAERGVVGWQGRMVDAPVVAQARRVLQRAGLA